MKIIFTFIITALIFQTAFSQNYKQVKIYINSIQEVEKLQQLGLEFDHPQLTKDNALVVFVNDDEYSKLQSLNYRYDILIENWFDHYKNCQLYLKLKK